MVRNTAFAATWRDQEGTILSTTFGGTICWHPVKQSKFTAVSENGEFEHIIRCRQCAGCLEFDRRRLATRLYKHFASSERDLWLLSIECEPDEQKRVTRSVRRTCGPTDCSTMLRLSRATIAFIVRGRRPHPPARALWRSYSATSQRIKRSRGKRAFNLATSGMLRPREHYGENLDRFYMRGLAPAEGERFTVIKNKGLRKRHPDAQVGARAWRDNQVLYAPEAWRPPRLVRRLGPLDRRYAHPLLVRQLLENAINGLASGPARSSQFPVIAGRESGRPNSGVKVLDLPTGRVRASVAPSPPLVAHSAAGPSAVPSLRPVQDHSPGRGNPSSRQLQEGEIDAWQRRMLAIRQKRGPDDAT